MKECDPSWSRCKNDATALVGYPVPDMTYNVFGGTLNLTQSIFVGYADMMT